MNPLSQLLLKKLANICALSLAGVAAVSGVIWTILSDQNHWTRAVGILSSTTGLAAFIVVEFLCRRFDSLESNELRKELEVTKQLAANLTRQQLPRRISEEVRQRMIAELSEFKGRRFRVLIAVGNDEGQGLCTDLVSVLRDGCGWVGADGVASMTLRSIEMTPGVMLTRNIEDVINETEAQKKSESLVMVKLITILADAGLVAPRRDGLIAAAYHDPNHIAPNSITIQIGAKPMLK